MAPRTTPYGLTQSSNCSRARLERLVEPGKHYLYDVPAGGGLRAARRGSPTNAQHVFGYNSKRVAPGSDGTYF